MSYGGVGASIFAILTGLVVTWLAIANFVAFATQFRKYVPACQPNRRGYRFAYILDNERTR